MSAQRDIKETAKLGIRAVLNSTPTCLPLRRLEVDYENLMKHKIPFRDMGYNTLPEFIADIPDVVTCWMSHGHMMVKAVEIKQTDNITRLVGLNRNRTRTPRNILPHQRQRDRCEPPRPVPQTNSSEYHILRGQIQGLLYSYKSGIRLSQFLEAFAKRFGHYINLSNIGFTSVRELLESMKDVVDVKQLADDFIVQSKVGPHATFQGFCNLHVLIIQYVQFSHWQLQFVVVSQT